MAENNSEQMNVQTVQTPDVNVSGQKKRVRVGFIFLSFVPVAVLWAIQTVSQVPFLILAALEAVSGVTSIEESAVAYTDMYNIFIEKYVEWTYLIYIFIALIVFGIWYYKGFVKRGQKVKISQVFGVKSIIAFIVAGIAVNFVINAALTIVYNVAPGILESYIELMEASGLTSDSILIIIYAVILGPVVEELCLRGLTFGFLEKSGIKPFLIVLLSGIFFGIMHLNLVQGLYASFLGFILGFLRYKYRSIMISIACHIVFNIVGMFGDSVMEKLGVTDGVLYILGGVSLLILVGVQIMVNRDGKAYKVPAENA